jgi:tRNA (guanine37-N1)-methyltransferase
MRSKCIKVPKSFGEEIRRKLQDRGILDSTLRIIRSDDHIFIPISDDYSKESSVIGEFEIIERDMEPIKQIPRTYKELLTLPLELKYLLPSSFDVVGDVAIIKIPSELEGYKTDIGRALRQANRNIKKVAVDRGVKGEFRVRDLEAIAGDDLETVHIENNIRLKMDPSRVFFSPRLASERMRIASLVRKGERILDMFAGVGPFSISIARHAKPSSIVGIDLNPECIRYFNLNISLNGLDGEIETYLGDSRDIVPTLGRFDRIILNLPHSSMDYLGCAMDAAETGWIHLYRIMDSENIMSEISRIKDIAACQERRIAITNMREVHNYSPSQHLMVLDVEVES